MRVRGPYNELLHLALEVELIAGESGEEVALPHSGVPYEHHLEQVVVLLVSGAHASAKGRPKSSGRAGRRLAGVGRITLPIAVNCYPSSSGFALLYLLLCYYYSW